MLDVVPVHKESQTTDSLTDIGITEHVLFVENGKIINGLKDSSRKIPTTALQAMPKSCQIITREGKKIEKFNNTEQKQSSDQVDKVVAVLKNMSDKIPNLGTRNINEGKSEDQVDGVAIVPQEMPYDDLHLGIRNNTMDEGKSKDQVDEVVTVLQEMPYEDFHLGLRNNTMDQGGVPCMDQEERKDQVVEVVTVLQETPYDDLHFGIRNNTMDEQKSEDQVDEVVTQEIPYKDLHLGIWSKTMDQEKCEDQVDENATIPQEMLDKLLHLELAIQERNIQLEELQNIVDSLKEKNTQLQNEKLEMISQHQGFLLENMQEVKKLKWMEESLRKKEKMLNDRLNEDVNATQTKEINKEKEEDWYTECMKACQRVREMEDCMSKQDEIMKELDTFKDKLIQDNKQLRIEIATMLVEDVSFSGLPKTLQGLEDIVKELRRSRVFVNGVRKKVRCFTKSDVAIEELQRMEKNTLVISIGDVFLSDEEKQAQLPTNPDDMLIKKPKIVKRHRMKNRQNRLFLNMENNTNLFLSPLLGGAVFAGCTQRKHNRVNIKNRIL
jgi:hypothetical protein